MKFAFHLSAILGLLTAVNSGIATLDLPSVYELVGGCRIHLWICKQVYTMMTLKKPCFQSMLTRKLQSNGSLFQKLVNDLFLSITVAGKIGQLLVTATSQIQHAFVEATNI